ncbi:hypothetical protein GS426_08025 [Rhodococcus hoagii]|nr:hypothetical protein [Prescottella equi]
MVVSNREHRQRLQPGRFVHSPGSYDQLPSDLREVISTHTTAPTPTRSATR